MASLATVYKKVRSALNCTDDQILGLVEIERDEVKVAKVTLDNGRSTEVVLGPSRAAVKREKDRKAAVATVKKAKAAAAAEAAAADEPDDELEPEPEVEPEQKG